MDVSAQQLSGWIASVSGKIGSAFWVCGTGWRFPITATHQLPRSAPSEGLGFILHVIPLLQREDWLFGPAPPMALPNGVLVHGLVQTTTAIVVTVLLQSAFSRPRNDCSKRYPVAHTHLPGAKESLGLQSAVARSQIVGFPDMGNLLQVERFTLPCPPP